MNLFEHEVRIAALLCGVGIPGDALDLELARTALMIHHLYPIRIDASNLAILHAYHIFGVRKKCRNIGGHIDRTFALAHHQRALLAGTDQIGRAGCQDGHGIRALHLLQGLADGLIEITFVIKMDEMGQNLAVRFGLKLIAHLGQAVLSDPGSSQ